MSYNLPPGCSGHVERSTDTVECARCGASVEHTFLSEFGHRSDDGYDCGDCGYHEDDPLPGEGYCVPCWRETEEAVPAKSGECAECRESRLESLDLGALVALICLCLSAAYGLPGVA